MGSEKLAWEQWRGIPLRLYACHAVYGVNQDRDGAVTQVHCFVLCCFLVFCLCVWAGGCLREVQKGTNSISRYGSRAFPSRFSPSLPRAVLLAFRAWPSQLQASKLPHKMGIRKSISIKQRKLKKLKLPWKFWKFIPSLRLLFILFTGIANSSGHFLSGHDGWSMWLICIG